LNRHSFLSFAVLSATLLSPTSYAEPDRVQGGRIAYHYVGRVSLDFVTSKAVVFGYFTHIDGIPAAVSLFRGTPGESTALFTFRADVNFQQLPGNGDVGNGMFAVSPLLVLPGEFKIYFDTNPNRTWTNANSFSTGLMVANLDRELEQMAIFGGVASNAATATLKSSESFTFDNRTFNFKNIARAVTNTTMGPLTPLPGSTQTAPTFAFAGYGIGAGK
jgi:hypothetical protein